MLGVYSLQQTNVFPLHFYKPNFSPEVHRRAGLVVRRTHLQISMTDLSSFNKKQWWRVQFLFNFCRNLQIRNQDRLNVLPNGACMATINLCCSANPALQSCKFISNINHVTAILFTSVHFSTKLPRNRFRNFHLLPQRSISSLEAKTAEEVEDYDDPTSILHRSGNEYLNQPQNVNKTIFQSQKPASGDKFSLNNSNFVIMAALTVGVAVFLIDQKAMALGPEGPLAEEFWENMRRYALYALTVSTGVAYAVFQPIYELLRNPISAILIIAIAAGGIYLVSQVLSAMVGVSDFTYDYSY